LSFGACQLCAKLDRLRLKSLELLSSLVALLPKLQHQLAGAF
jgi:hypothetical protein